MKWWLTIRQRGSLYLDLIRWDRPAGWLLLLWPTLLALWVGAGGFPGWHLLLVFVLGTVLMRSAGCCINDVVDREFDRHVKRTAQRPVTSGAVSVPEALAVGAVLALLAFVLVLGTNLTTVLWSLGALGVTLLYPFAKRYVSMPQAVLGVAFSFGIPMAYAALERPLDAKVLALVLGNLCWVLAYDTEYAMVDRDDDLKIGMKTSAITLGRWDVLFVMACYGVYWGMMAWVVSTHLRLATQTLAVWWGVLCVLTLPQVMWHYSLIRSRERGACFQAFRVNHWLGAAVFACAAVGLWAGG